MSRLLYAWKVDRKAGGFLPAETRCKSRKVPYSLHLCCVLSCKVVVLAAQVDDSGEENLELTRLASLQLSSWRANVAFGLVLLCMPVGPTCAVC